MTGTRAQYCANCAFWQPLDAAGSHGECRRVLARPISLSRPEVRRWPIPDAVDGCLQGWQRLPDTPQASCASCVAFRAGTTPTRQGRVVGECRMGLPARRPSVKGRAGASWPSTVDDLWCGEWVPLPAVTK
jgi:hypothetical protein